MAGPDPNIIDPFINSWKTCRELEREKFHPGPEYWASLADMIAKAVVSYLEATLPPLPSPDPSTIGSPSEKETQRAAKDARRRKILEMWEEFDREKEKR